MSKKKTNKQKQNTRAKRKAQNAKVAQSTKKAQQPKTVKVKAAEPLSTPNLPQSATQTAYGSENISQHEETSAGSFSAATLKREPSVSGPQKVQDLGPAKAAKVTTFSYSTRGIAALCVFLVAFSLMYNVTIDTMGSNFETTTEAPTTALTTVVATTVEETTTETTTYQVTQAPTVVYTRQAAAAAHVAVQTGKKLSVPYVSQLPKYPTGCEAASATMVLRYWGYGYSLDTVVNSIPSGLIYNKNGKAYGPSIYEKFVGDPRCTYTSATPGYGCFSPVVTGALNRLLDSDKHIAVNITGSSMSTLFKYIDEGCPVIVWSTYSMQTPKTANAWYIEGTDEYFQYPRGTHVTVLYGYDNSNVYMMDPYTGGSRTFTQSAFSSKYNLLGMQAVVVIKVEPTTAETTTEEISEEDIQDPIEDIEEDIDTPEGQEGQEKQEEQEENPGEQEEPGQQEEPEEQEETEEQQENSEGD